MPGTSDDLRRSGLPIHDGELACRDLHGSVRIVRDAHGVPHIKAGSEHDLWFAQGFCHGQDRLWQLERFRRFARGTLSEILGEALVPVDRFYRRLGVQRYSERDWPELGSEARKILRWFSDGVNAAITTFEELPPEFQLLGIQPDWWSPIDSIAVWRVIAYTQMRDYQLKIFAGAVHERYGAEAVALLQPDYPGEAPVIVPSGSTAVGLDKEWARVRELSQELVAAAAQGAGSNSWAVDGSKTASGAPLLAGDPHAVVQLSPVWYLNHLVHQDFDVIGASTPGVPGVLMYGHNHHVAWAVTNAMADVSDLFVERFSDDFSAYEHRGEWLAPEVWQEEIPINGRDEPLREEILVTRHGPVVSGGPGEDGPVLAHQWSGHDVLRTLETIPDSFRARDVDAYIDSQLTWSGPPMNKVVADAGGNIAYKLVGDVPVRAHGGPNPVPVAGWSGEYDWVGSIAFEDTPSSRNPQTHYVATANNQVADSDYPHWIGTGTPWRAWRIESLLDRSDALDVAAFQGIQNDRRTMAAPLLAQALEALTIDDDLKPSAELLRGWDGVLAPESAAALVYVTTGRLLMARLYGFLADLPAGGVGAGTWGAWPSARVLAAIRDDDRALLTLNPQLSAASWDELFNEALRAALAAIRESQGDDPGAWRWDALQRQTFIHNLGRQAPHDATFNLPAIGVGGDGTTVAASIADARFRSFVGVSFRMVVDLADFARSVWVLPPGNVGHPGSPHHGDGVAPWLAGQYWSMSTRPEDYEADAESTLLLRPERA